MENEKLNERESLRLISDMIERSRKAEISRLNFVTLYGVMGLVLTVLEWIGTPEWVKGLWIVVPVVAYGVPYVHEKMWRKPMTIVGRIVRQGWKYFAWLAIISAVYGVFDAPRLILALMVLPLSCALFMLSGMFKDKSVLVMAFWGMVWSVMTFADTAAMRSSRIFCFCLFFAVCILCGFDIAKKKN